ncbi:formylmethanofuran dehydrogenase subunit C [bacterium]|nr:formylmethanofuran dehydrogenase subunit C [bacterium]MDB4809715.1 formylmethanofuran dehydrogenase subunit C [bacterium]
MKPITLKLKREPTVTLEAEVICPDGFAEMSHEQIAASVVYHGKRQVRLDEFFDIEGERSEHLVLHGSLQRVRHLGRGMSCGSMTIHGDVGMHLGALMKGGQIEVFGNVSDWIGAEMSAGEIHVHGSAGQQVGAAYRGSLAGMRGGLIVIDGSAGIEVGMRMRKGTIIIGGPAKDFAGLQMKGGTIILRDGAEIRTGAWMHRGTIISLKPLALMPTFAESGQYNPTFVSVFSRLLRRHGFELPNDPAKGVYQRYAGDRSVPGKGEILIWKGHPEG